MTRLLALLLLTLVIVKPAQAEPPRIVTDIAPVHSLVSMVMQGIGEPDILIPSGASPHDFALRPSDARNLAQADAVIWIGADLTPGLARSISALAEDATSLQLLKSPDTFVLPYRKGAVFEHDDDHHADDSHAAQKDHDGDDHTGHKHNDHHDGHDHNHDAEHDAERKDHDDHARHDDHEDHAGHAGHDGHHHGKQDPHAWQDPKNATVWLNTIAELLGELDPDNAAAYRSNADAASVRIDVLADRVHKELQPLKGRGFVVTHDAFHYFEHRFDIHARAAISPGDATPASAARLQQVTREMQTDAAVCIFIEPQMSRALTQTFAEEHGAKVGVIDPLGAAYQNGPDQYLKLLQGISDGLRECLS